MIPGLFNSNNHICTIDLYSTSRYNLKLKGGKRPPPFLRGKWGSGGRRFKSGHPDIHLSNTNGVTKTRAILLRDMQQECEIANCVK
jgi:hypothetical protein